MPGALRISDAVWATWMVAVPTDGVGERHEARGVVVDIDEHPLGVAGLTVEVDLAHTAQPLPARIEDVAAGPLGIVPEEGLAGKLGHKVSVARCGHAAVP